MSELNSARPGLLSLRRPLVQALFALALMIALGCVFHADGAFFKWQTHRGTLRQISVTGILACGMTVVIITAGIDLAVGSLLALTAVCFAKLAMHSGIDSGLAVAACLAVGVVAGSISGLLVALPRIQPFVVTLAMMVFARGVAKLISGGAKVTNTFEDDNGTLVIVDQPQLFELLDGRVLGGNVSIVTLVFGASVLVTWFVLSKLRIGRYLFAIGGNVEAARLSGVPVRRVLVLAYAMCGLFAAVAGICQAAQETHGDPATGAGYELDAIAMVVVGGTSLMGGRGSVLLTLVGALTIGYLQKILSINQFSTDARLMLTGAILILAVLVQRQR